MTLPYKYRGIVLLAGLAVVLPWIAWHFALRDTCAALRDCRHMAARLETLAPETAQPAAVGAGECELVLSGGLLDMVRRAATERSVQVAGYEPLVTAEHDGVAVHTAQLTLTGGYASLLRVVDTLERTLPACRLRSLVWQAVPDRRTRKIRLTLTLYIQQIVLKK